MLVRALSMLLALTLGACSVAWLRPDWTSADAAGPEPAYRFFIANAISVRDKTIIGDPSQAGVLEISSARRVDSLQGASWLVCIQAQRFPLPPRYYAVFFQRERIVNSRLSVVIDQCELQTYSSFDWIGDANKPPTMR